MVRLPCYLASAVLVQATQRRDAERSSSSSSSAAKNTTRRRGRGTSDAGSSGEQHGTQRRCSTVTTTARGPGDGTDGRTQRRRGETAATDGRMDATRTAAQNVASRLQGQPKQTTRRGDERRSDGTWRDEAQGSEQRAERGDVRAVGANGDDDHIGRGVSLCEELNQSGTHARAVTGEVVTACQTAQEHD